MQQKADLRYYLLDFTLIFVPLWLLVSGLLLYIYQSETKSVSEIVKAQEKNKVAFLFDVMSKEYAGVTADLMMISGLHEMKKFLDGNHSDVNDLAEDLLAFSLIKKKYDQIRYLDKTGDEVIRINFNNGKPSIVPSDKLQNKAKRYYFKDTFTLNKGEIFVSPLDLNIERGKIEIPIKPMIRIGAPVYSSTGGKKGILLLNYFGESLINNLIEGAGDDISQLSLLNPSGYWLKGPEPDEEWGFMYEEKKEIIFGKKHFEAWKKIAASDSGQFINDQGLFTFTTLYPLLEYHKSSSGNLDRKEYYFKIVYHIPDCELTCTVETIAQNLLWVYIPFVLILFVGALAYAHFKENKRKEDINREKLIQDLRKALDDVKTLEGILPICSYCRKIRNDEGEYEQMEGYMYKKSGLGFSHTICPSCMNEHYPEDDDE